MVVSQFWPLWLPGHFLLQLLRGSLFEAEWLVQFLEAEVEVFQWGKVLLALATPYLGSSVGLNPISQADLKELPSSAHQKLTLMVDQRGEQGPECHPEASCL